MLHDKVQVPATLNTCPQVRCAEGDSVITVMAGALVDM